MSSHAVTIIDATTTEGVISQILEQARELLIPKRAKAQRSSRHRPILIHSDKTIEKYVRKRTIIKDGRCLFEGERYFEPQLWSTETQSDIKRIAQFVIDRNTIR